MRHFHSTQNTEKFVKKIIGENEINTVLRRLDRLTLDEARATGAQTLEVVYGLVQNRRAIMDGENTVIACPSFVPVASRCIPLDLDDMTSASVDSVRNALGEFHCLRIKMLFELALEIIQKIAGDMNRPRRELFIYGTTAD
jgi:hypothetical protein